MKSITAVRFIKNTLYYPVLLFIGAVLFSYLLQASPVLQLIVEEPGSGTVHYTIPCRPGDTFILSYRHSVNRSMVYGTFRLTRDEMIQPLTTSFSSFGPGLPWLDEKTDHTIVDGQISVEHREPPRTEIRLWVTPQTEETILLNDITCELASLTSEPLLLRIFSVKRRR